MVCKYSWLAKDSIFSVLLSSPYVYLSIREDLLYLFVYYLVEVAFEHASHDFYPYTKTGVINSHVLQDRSLVSNSTGSTCDQKFLDTRETEQSSITQQF